MKPADKKLLAAARKLAEAERKTLLDFAEFLASRTEVKAEPLVEPVLTPRPADESVVAAIKRLSASYPMLDRSKMLNETSVLMTQHVIHGRDKHEVIDELEVVFQTHYEMLRDQGESDT